MVYHSVNGFFALRKNEWVFVDCKGSGGWTLPEETAKKLPDTQLYNLKMIPPNSKMYDLSPGNSLGNEKGTGSH